MTRVFGGIAILAYCQFVAAQPHWTVSWRFEGVAVSETVAELRAAGQTILRWRGLGALYQVQALAEQLNALLWKGTKPKEFVMVKVQGGYAITVNGQPLLTITHALARASRSDPKALAEQWLKRLREVFERGWLAVPAIEVVVPVGEEVSLPLLGTAEGTVQVEAKPPELVRWKVSGDGRTVTVRGAEVGAGILRIVKGTKGVRLPLRVLYRAANWKTAPVAWGRGRQISAAMVREAVENAVMMALEVRLGARWTLLPVDNAANFFAPNLVTRWRLQAMGEQLLPLDEIVSIPLCPLPQSLGEADLLVISNEPETFRDFRLLCRGLLPPTQTVRFMVHHRNGLARPAWLALEFHNTEDRWVPLLVRFGYGTPRVSELRCGHDATASFLQALLYDAAIRLHLPPQSVYRLLRFGMKPNETVSALVEVRLEETASVGYRVTALPLAPPKSELLTGTQLVDALVATADPPPYPKPLRALEETHVAGDRWTFISVGRFGLQHPLKGRVLHGNYGVLYRITLRFVNPTERLWKAQVVVEPTGGVVRGAFVVDGRLVEIPLLRPYEEHILHEFPLAPKQTRVVTVITIPSAGSFYPIQLIARTK